MMGHIMTSTKKECDTNLAFPLKLKQEVALMGSSTITSNRNFTNTKGNLQKLKGETMELSFEGMGVFLEEMLPEQKRIKINCQVNRRHFLASISIHFSPQKKD